MKRLRIIGLIICCGLFVFSSIEIALANTSKPTLRYDGKAKEFTYVNTEATDLFREFKDVVPGDSITQEIILRGDNIQTATDIYLRAQSTDGVVLPESITLKVYLDDQLLSDSSLNHSGSLTEDVHLYQFTSSGIVKLKALLEVPVSVGNEISNVQKEIQWIFTAEEVGETEEKPQSGGITDDKLESEENHEPDITPQKGEVAQRDEIPKTEEIYETGGIPKTGDRNMLIVYIVMNMISIGGLISILVSWRKNV